MRDFTFLRLSAIMLVAISTVSASTAYAAAIVTPLSDGSSASATALINLLLGPAPNLSVVAGSAQYTGAVAASGTFTNGGTGPTGVGLDSGVVLTTGDARFLGSSAEFLFDNANKTDFFTAGAGNLLTENTAPGNSLFEALAPFGTENASILSFMFVPQGTSLTLQLVFGSEDYNDLVNAPFPTDVFGVFVNGVNYALVPGTSLPISASTVNCGSPSQNCSLYRDNPPFSDLIDTEIDGFTVAIKFTIPVNLNVPNTISIGIADHADPFSDSALLLAGGSIAVVPEPSTIVLMLAGIAGWLVSRDAGAARWMTRRKRHAGPIPMHAKSG